MFKVSILLYEEDDELMPLEAGLLSNLRKAGFAADYASKSLQELDMNPEKIAEFVSANPSDAWVVIAASGTVLEWFSGQPFPTLAMFGTLSEFPIAGVGPNHRKSLEECIDRLIKLRHSKIVMFTRKERRQPKPGVDEQILLDALQSNNLPIDQDTLPEWEESLKGFRTSLEALFQKTPPTGIIVQETSLMMVLIQFLKARGLATPDHVSLFCMDYTASFDWCDPKPAHSRWKQEKVLHRIVEWAKNVSKGEKDITHTIFDSEFIDGSTIGPPPSSARNKMTEGKVW